MKVVINEGERVPSYYGLAYRLFDRQVAVCYPIPFNRIVRVYRDIVFWLRWPDLGLRDRVTNNAYNNGFDAGRTQNKIDAVRLDAEYARGLRDGFRVGTKEGMRIADEAIMRAVTSQIIVMPKLTGDR